MTDYAATALQPLAQALVTIAAPGGALSFAEAKGFSAVVRDAAAAQGAYILTFDPGLPGEAGAVNPDEARTIVTPRSAGGPPPVSGVAAIGVTYIVSATPGIGATQVEITLQTIAGAFVDPAGLAFEVVVFRGPA